MLERSDIPPFAMPMHLLSSLLFQMSPSPTDCGLYCLVFIQVTYDSTGFLDKNKDTMPGRAIALLRTSTNDLINLLFTGSYEYLTSCVYCWTQTVSLCVANITKTGTLALGRLTLQRLKKKVCTNLPMGWDCMFIICLVIISWRIGDQKEGKEVLPWWHQNHQLWGLSSR